MVLVALSALQLPSTASVINRDDMESNHNKVENKANPMPWSLLTGGEVILRVAGDAFSRKFKLVRNVITQT